MRKAPAFWTMPPHRIRSLPRNPRSYWCSDMKSLLPASALLALLVMLPVQATPVTPTPLVDNPQATPTALIKQATGKVLVFLKTHRPGLRQDPRQTALLLAGQLLPYFDFSLTAEYVLGRYWRSTTPAEQKHFERFFYHYLIHTFATALRHYRGARVQVKPYQGSLSGHYVQVMSEIHTQGGQSVGVTYALYRTARGWRIFDVSVEGISYVMSFRKQFEPILERVGVAGLIRELQDKTIHPAVHAPSG